MQSDPLYIYMLNHLSADLLARQTDQTSGSGLAVPLPLPTPTLLKLNQPTDIWRRSWVFYVKCVQLREAPWELYFFSAHYLFGNQRVIWRANCAKVQAKQSQRPSLSLSLCFSLLPGTNRSNFSADLRVLFGVCLFKRSESYEGVNPFRDLKTNN